MNVLSVLTASIVLIALLFILLGGTLWIGISLLLCGLVGVGCFTNINAFNVLSNIMWNNVAKSTMISLPLFVLMGELIFATDMAEKLFKGLSPWMNKIPGRLLHVTVVACAMFAAVSGSSAATCATVGKIVIPETDKRNYNRGVSLGTLGAAGTLGFLIPPSMIMLVYGITADVSIGKLFIAGFIPGIVLAGAFSLYIIIRSLMDPRIAPSDGIDYTWKDRIEAIPYIFPVLFLITIVLGSIYMGWATPTEAATVGVLGSLFLSFLSRSLNWGIFKKAIYGTVKTSSMIMLIMIGASFLSVAVVYLGISEELTAFIANAGVSPYMLIVILSIMYLIMGCLLDGFSMVVMSIPIALPLIIQAGFDPLWFGIYLVIMIQISQITPPVGFNLYVINGMTGEDIFFIAKNVIPQFIVMLIITAVITLYPGIVMYLPNMMIK
jgi:C4-dicarboxylate transporter DctM subunit